MQRDLIILFDLAKLLWLRWWLVRPAQYLDKNNYYWLEGISFQLVSLDFLNHQHPNQDVQNHHHSLYLCFGYGHGHDHYFYEIQHYDMVMVIFLSVTIIFVMVLEELKPLFINMVIIVQILNVIMAFIVMRMINIIIMVIVIVSWTISYRANLGMRQSWSMESLF